MPGWAVGERKFRVRDILVFKSNRNRLLCTHHWLLHFSIEISILRPICKYPSSWAGLGRGERGRRGCAGPAAPGSGRSVPAPWQTEGKNAPGSRWVPARHQIKGTPFAGWKTINISTAKWEGRARTKAWTAGEIVSLRCFSYGISL